MDSNDLTPLKKVIGDSLGINRQELSQTFSRREPFVCATCGAKFERTVWYRNGEPMLSKALTECEGCQTKRRYNEDKAKVEARLPVEIETQRQLWADASGISDIGSKTFENFNRGKQPKAYDAVKNLRWAFDEDKTPSQGRSLVLVSPNIFGLGKTHLVKALAWQIIQTEEAAYIRDEYGHPNIHRYRTPPVRLYQENALMRRIRDTYKHKDEGESEEDVYHEISHAPLAIFDDVGKVRPRDLSFSQGVWFSIIDERYESGSPIVLTTNLTLDELESHIGGACADRLREMCGKDGIVVMSGTSYRRA